jgi:processive 1,2-diacylglycerol beta-glucosyltransferase
MSGDDRYCPTCGARFPWYEETCDDCGAALVAHRPGGDPAPDAALVPVLQSAEGGLIDLARIALEQAGIYYAVQPASEAPHRKADRQLWGITSGPPDAAAVVVLEHDADRAREVLSGLQHDAGAIASAGSPPPASGRTGPTGVASIVLRDAERGTFIGRVSEAQLDFLVEQLEQESEQDRSYYVDAATIDMLAAAGADETLVTLLRCALAGREGVDITWMDGA